MGKATQDRTGRTCIFLILRIRGLKEDLDTVERRNDRLCLGRWRAVMSAGPVAVGRSELHTTHPATPPAMPERITWSVVFILEASELIRSQCAYASRCGVQKTEMLRPERGYRSSCDSFGRPCPCLSSDATTSAMTSKAKSDVKALKGQDGAHLF